MVGGYLRRRRPMGARAVRMARLEGVGMTVRKPGMSVACPSGLPDSVNGLPPLGGSRYQRFVSRVLFEKTMVRAPGATTTACSEAAVVLAGGKGSGSRWERRPGRPRSLAQSSG